jgi:hypothetical protein
MAKFLCVCGYQISTSGEIPNQNEWHFLSDVEFGHYSGTVAVEELYLKTEIFYRCPVSDHLWVFWDGIDADAKPRLYSPTELPPGW